MRMGLGTIVLAALLALAGCGDGGEARGAAPAAAGEGEQEPREGLGLAADVPVPGTPPPGVSPAALEEGQRLYATSCVVCHGPEGEGTQLGPSLVDEESIHLSTGSFPEMVEVVRAGVAEPEEFPVPMHAYGELLTEQEVQAVTAYAYSLRRL